MGFAKRSLEYKYIDKTFEYWVMGDQKLLGFAKRSLEYKYIDKTFEYCIWCIICIYIFLWLLMRKFDEVTTKLISAKKPMKTSSFYAPTINLGI